MDNRQSTININLGKLSMPSPPPSSSSTRNRDQQQQQQDSRLSTFSTYDQLKNYIKLKASTRNYALHFFQDRYSIMFMYAIRPGACEYTSIYYDIMDTTNDIGSYAYTTHYIQESNEDACVQYIRTLRQLVGMNAPPNLALMHRTNTHFMCELTSNMIATGKFSRKNSRDIVFQVLFVLSCMYMCDCYIDGINIAIVVLQEPVNLVYKIGSIHFTLQDVLVIPFIRPITTKFKIYNSNKSQPTDLLNAYRSSCDHLRSILSDDLAIPYMDDSVQNINECIFAYLLMEYESDSNLCTFEPAIEDLRVSNKFTSRSCLLTNARRGNVFYDEHDKSINVQLNNNLCYRMSTASIEPMPVANMTQMISIKEQQVKKYTPPSMPTIRSFTFNGT